MKIMCVFVSALYNYSSSEIFVHNKGAKVLFMMYEIFLKTQEKISNDQIN